MNIKMYENEIKREIVSPNMTSLLGNYHSSSPRVASRIELKLIYYSRSGAVGRIEDQVQGSMSGETHQSYHRPRILNSRRLAAGPRMSPTRRMWRFWNLQYLLGSPTFIKPSIQQGQIWPKWRIDIRSSHCSYCTKLLCTSFRIVNNPKR
jgi:hypothetical protein